MSTDRQHAHKLLDQLDPGQLAAVIHLLQVMTSPFLHSLSVAEVEENELTPEMAAVLARARNSLSRGEGIDHKEIQREFGLDK